MCHVQWVRVYCTLLTLSLLNNVQWVRVYCTLLTLSLLNDVSCAMGEGILYSVDSVSTE